MKAAKIILSTLGVTLATISFGQLVSLHETTEEPNLNIGKIIDNNSEVLFYSAEYNEESGNVIHWVNYLPDRDLRDVSANDDKPTIVSRTYFAKELEVLYESVPVIEAWMTLPFENGFLEPDLDIETWMTEKWY
ncbi:MAG: hypothetical protein DRJ13_16775 [Bacteroidetes bacterium]|nr:MAG: hypothetical protein DRJ13_16775 [Bacteroidota bacterium]